MASQEFEAVEKQWLSELREKGALTPEEFEKAWALCGTPWDISYRLLEDHRKLESGAYSEGDFIEAKDWYFADAARRQQSAVGTQHTKLSLPPYAIPVFAALGIGGFVVAALSGDALYKAIGTLFDGVALIAFVIGCIILFKARTGDRRAGLGCLAMIGLVAAASGIATSIKNIPERRAAAAEEQADDRASAAAMGVSEREYTRAKAQASDAWSACRVAVVKNGGADAMNPDIVPNYSWRVSNGIIHISGRDMKVRLPGVDAPVPYECDYDVSTKTAILTD